VLSKSAFFFSCICGRAFQKEERETFRCPDCGRLLVLDWRPETEAPRTEPALVNHPDVADGRQK
jgi:DNA-directed RNA polymerase subunit RPC12/RpoP